MDDNGPIKSATDLYHLIMVDIQEYAFILLDQKGLIVDWNTGAENIFGFSKAEITGNYLGTLFLPEDVERRVPEAELATALRTGRALDERWHATNKGVRFWASGFTVALYSADNVHQGFAKIAQDATSRKVSELERDALLTQVQAALRDATKAHNDAETARQNAEMAMAQAQAARNEALAADRFKDEFIRQVSHELRTPLNGILLWTKLIGDGVVGQDMLHRGLEAIKRSAESSQHLIDDLLESARLRTGKVRLSLGDVEIGTMVHRVSDDLAPQIEEKNLDLMCHIPEEEIVISGDEQRLEQVMRVLLSNAIKFTPAQGRIDLTVRATAGHTEIVVQDSGIGFNSEFTAALFEPYRQEERPEGPQEGLGLGLFIAKGLVELHGGTILGVSPGPNAGSIFTIRLPHSQE